MDGEGKVFTRLMGVWGQRPQQAKAVVTDFLILDMWLMTQTGSLTDRLLYRWLRPARLLIAYCTDDSDRLAYWSMTGSMTQTGSLTCI